MNRDISFKVNVCIILNWLGGGVIVQQAGEKNGARFATNETKLEKNANDFDRNLSRTAKTLQL